MTWPNTLTKGFVLAALVLTLPAAALAKTQGQTRREMQLSACAGDMARLCPGTLSDSKKFKTCVRPRRDQVSARCRAWLDVPE